MSLPGLAHELPSNHPPRPPAPRRDAAPIRAPILDPAAPTAGGDTAGAARVRPPPVQGERRGEDVPQSSPPAGMAPSCQHAPPFAAPVY